VTTTRQRTPIELALRDHQQSLLPFVWAISLVILVAGPWLAPGYIFGTDFSGPRHYSFPTGSSSYDGLQLVLALGSSVLPGDVVGKAFVVSILLGAALSSFLAVPTTGFTPRAVASLVYVFNPFVYDRLSYGQMTVLAGYAALPWVAMSLRELLSQPSVKRCLLAAASLTVTGILDVHMAIVATVPAVCLTIAYLADAHKDPATLAKRGKFSLASGLIALVASSYWLIPLAAGRGLEANTLSAIGRGDLYVFSTVSDPHLGLLPNALGLYGFWAEHTGRFPSMKEFVPVWPFVLALLLAIAIIGLLATLRVAELRNLRPWAFALAVAGLVALVLDLGIADAHVAPLVSWLDATLPPYRGMRDSSKWAAMLALTYSQLTAIGAASLLGWIRRRGVHWRGQELAMSIVVAFVLSTPLYYGNGVLYGMHRQIQPSAYPAGWYAADKVLVADPNPGRAVFLPWHAYMGYSFVRNVNPVILSPAPTFFSIPVVASRDLEIAGIPPPTGDPDQTAVGELVKSGAQGHWAPALARRGIKYVLVAHELDWNGYHYLDSQSDLQLVGDYGSITVYRNLLWQKGSG
jgi:hypothetical protein